MPSEPVFTVIIPTRDRPHHLRRCLEGLTRLTFPRSELEVIVADDGSRPPCRSIHAEFEETLPLRFVCLEGNGPAAARNAAAGAARGRYLAFLDDDCVPSPDWLDELLCALEAEPGCLAGGRTVNAAVTNPYSEASQTLVHYLYAYFNREPRRARFLVSCNMALSRRDFEAFGGFDERFRLAGGEDRDFCDRWLASQRPMVYATRAVVLHHHDLSLKAFLAQQARYGRGAYYFHQSRLSREEKVRVEPFRFYAEMLRWPFRVHSDRPVARRLAISTLLALSQAANIAGYFYESVRGSLRR